MAENDDYITTTEAAEILGLKSRQGVNWLITEGKLQATRIGSGPRSRWLIRRQDVERLKRGREGAE